VATSVLRDQLQRHLLASAADPDRRVRLLHRLRLVDRSPQLVEATVERRFVLRPHRLDHLQRLAQHAQPIRGFGVFVPVSLVLVLVPTGADAEDQPAAAHHVDAARHLRE